MALTYIKESHRTRTSEGVEIALCPACLADSHWATEKTHAYDRHGYILIIKPWTGENRECSYCPTLHEAPRNGKVLALVLLIALALPGFAAAQTGPIAALVTANVLDAISTEAAVRRAGVVEANPIMGQTTAQRVVVKSAGTVVQVWLVRKVGQRHPAAAKVLGYGMSAAFSVVAAHNFRVGR